MDNHVDRPEIQQALMSETGWSERFSDTLRYDLLYVARAVMQDERPTGIIRLAVPLIEVNRSVNRLRLKIDVIVILLFLVSGGFIIWQTNRIRKYVNRIKDYAGALRLGLFGKKLYLQNAGEFTELANDLNEMSSELEGSIKKGEEETKRLNVILRSIPDALLLIQTNGNIELSNNAARDLFGDSRLDGRHFIEVVRSSDFSALIEKVKQERLSGSAELSVDIPDEKHLAVRVSPLFYKAGEMAGIVAIFHDMTHVKKLEQMRKDFVANVSHEIKTPITAIGGFAETLLDGAMYDRDNAEKFLSTIRSHSERLNRLVEDLLMISRIELGVIKIHKTQVNITDIIDSTLETFAVFAAQKDIALKKSVREEHVYIYADRDRLEQVLLNLMDNAVKFTEKGEIEIGTAHDGERNYFFVKDTGIGIPGKYLSRIGERFFRVDPSRSRELGGTGLGLAIVKHLVKAHGWMMRVESETGRGTVVRIFY
jgi:two-component system phosphate regulon sensor histidine kinase PhoR